MTDKPFKQTLTITLETNSEKIECSYTEDGGISSNDAFWWWFMPVWETLGVDFVRKEMERNDK